MSIDTPIAETDHFIILDRYTKINQSQPHHQSEAELERELIADLTAQGYEYRQDLNSNAKLLANIREQLQRLNKVQFSDQEWERFVTEYLDHPADTNIEKSRKIHHHYIHDFTFDNGVLKNIYLLDKKQVQNNRLQIINQFEQTGSYSNRYDVTILVNGLPLVQIELKKRGVAIREAFNQIHRYSKESFNSEHSLYRYLQVFVISNGTNTLYFANTTKRNKNSFDFTINWASSDNEVIHDLKDFTATFFSRHTLLNLLTKYCVLDTSDTLLLMRPYQIAATERILWKITRTYENKTWHDHKGGYIWHTTGSGKTLTSFKAARLASELEFIDKVFFVVDRKDLDYQTIKEYQRFSPDSVNGSENTAGLKRNIESQDNKIIVTTLQKLNNLMKAEANLAIYRKKVVFIFDECHRSQFGESQKNIKKKFKQYCQFGFTGTPIFQQNALTAETTEQVFGTKLHTYVITDAIRDKKVLKFKVDYNDVRPKFKAYEQEQDLEKLSALETRQALQHPDRLKSIAQYILNNFHSKTHRANITGRGFNAMFAVSSVEMAKQYYEIFKQLQSETENPLKIATIFSFAANEEQQAQGEIEDENFEPSAMNSSAKEFLQMAINDYNQLFKTNYSLRSNEFQNYYRDLARRVRDQEVDLLLVVGMFLTGFDAPQLNTLFVDKNLRYHGLIQAYSRTNRIFDSRKSFGNIVTFRDLEQATIDALSLFADGQLGNAGQPAKIVLERSYQEYMHGYTDDDGEQVRGYCDLVAELQTKFPDPANIVTEAEKKAFVKLFGKYLRVENVLKNYDEYQALIQQEGATPSENQLQEPAGSYSAERILPERNKQDYLSSYYDIRNWFLQEKQGKTPQQAESDWQDVVFEVDLLKSQEINLDYILQLIFDKNKQLQNKAALIEDIRKIVRASGDHRGKEELIVEFIQQLDLSQIVDQVHMIEEFFQYAKKMQQQEADHLIKEEKLNEEPARRYLSASLKRGFASDTGTDLHEVLPKLSPLNPQYHSKKRTVWQKIQAFVGKFKGIGGSI